MKRPLIGRDGRSGYLMAMAISFALTVSFTRAFLAASGYPKVGGDTFHLAHAVWGGLILIGTSIAPLMYASRRVFTASAVLSGVGAGLFIDEIGKFITAKNDYFFPLAATLIYVFGLGMAWLATRVNANRGIDESTMASSCLELMGDVIDRSLTEHELARLTKYATTLQSSKLPPYVETGNWVMTMLTSHKDDVRARPPGRLEQGLNRAKKWEVSHFGERATRWFITAMAAVEISVMPMIVLMALGVIQDSADIGPILEELFHATSLDSSTEQIMYVAVSVATVLVQIALLVGLIGLWRGRRAWASRLMVSAMAIQVVVVNTLSGYFDIVYLVYRLMVDVPLLLTLIRYRQRFVPEGPTEEVV